ncbi:hypothetical protein BJX99DRAFT_260081 [Aspergillus californicus]
MKRRAPPSPLILSTNPSSAYTQINAGVDADKQPAKRNASDFELASRTSVNRYHHDLTAFCDRKMRSLSSPFPGGPDAMEGTADEVLLLNGYRGIARPVQAQDTPPYKEAEGSTPLGNDSIANILRQCKPACPKARSWVYAHNDSKVAQERRFSLPEGGGLRRQVLQRGILHLQAPEAGRTRGKIHQVLSRVQPQEPKDAEAKCWVKLQEYAEADDDDEERVAVKKAHIRARAASVRLRSLCDDENAEGVAKRFTMEELKYMAYGELH